MPTLLHLDSSPRPESYSNRVTDAFAQAWLAANPESTYIHRDLVTAPVPHLDAGQVSINGLMASGDITSFDGVAGALRTDAQRAAWAITRPLTQELLDADVVLIGSPMYNYTVSSHLKSWIDRVSMPVLMPNQDGVSPLNGKTVIVATSRGGSYAPGTPREPGDFQEPYLRYYFDAVGLSGNVHFLTTEMTFSESVPALAQFSGILEGTFTAALTSATELATPVAV